jgi:hypothetical protein
MDLITRAELFDAIENDPAESEFKIAANFLQSAIIDWPTDISEPQVLINELKKEIAASLTFDNLNCYRETLRPEFNACKMEAISELLELFDFDRTNNFDKKIELEMIIERITMHYRK